MRKMITLELIKDKILNVLELTLIDIHDNYPISYVLLKSKCIKNNIQLIDLINQDYDSFDGVLTNNMEDMIKFIMQLEKIFNININDEITQSSFISLINEIYTKLNF